MTFTSLQIELICEVLKWCDIKSLSSLSMTSKCMRNICETPWVIDNSIKRHFDLYVISMYHARGFMTETIGDTVYLLDHNCSNGHTIKICRDSLTSKCYRERWNKMRKRTVACPYYHIHINQEMYINSDIMYHINDWKTIKWFVKDSNPILLPRYILRYLCNKNKLQRDLYIFHKYKGLKNPCKHHAKYLLGISKTPCKFGYNCKFRHVPLTKYQLRSVLTEHPINTPDVPCKFHIKYMANMLDRRQIARFNAKPCRNGDECQFSHINGKSYTYYKKEYSKTYYSKRCTVNKNRNNRDNRNSKDRNNRNSKDRNSKDCKVYKPK